MSLCRIYLCKQFESVGISWTVIRLLGVHLFFGQPTFIQTGLEISGSEREMPMSVAHDRAQPNPKTRDAL